MAVTIEQLQAIANGQRTKGIHLYSYKGQGRKGPKPGFRLNKPRNTPAPTGPGRPRKVPQDVVDKIREGVDSGEWNQKELAEFYGLSRAVVHKIVNYKSPYQD